jgi:hypothetical protein
VRLVHGAYSTVSSVLRSLKEGYEALNDILPGSVGNEQDARTEAVAHNRAIAEQMRLRAQQTQVTRDLIQQQDQWIHGLRDAAIAHKAVAQEMVKTIDLQAQMNMQLRAGEDTVDRSARVYTAIRQNLIQQASDRRDRQAMGRDLLRDRAYQRENHITTDDIRGATGLTSGGGGGGGDSIENLRRSVDEARKKMEELGGADERFMREREHGHLESLAHMLHREQHYFEEVARAREQDQRVYSAYAAHQEEIRQHEQAQLDELLGRYKTVRDSFDAMVRNIGESTREKAVTDLTFESLTRGLQTPERVLARINDLKGQALAAVAQGAEGAEDQVRTLTAQANALSGALDHFEQTRAAAQQANDFGKQMAESLTASFKLTETAAQGSATFITDAFQQIGAAFKQHLAAVIQGREGLSEALHGMAEDVLLNLAVQAAGEAAFNIAQAIGKAALSYGTDPTIEGHLAAAAAFAALAVGSGVIAGGMYQSDAAHGKGGSSPGSHMGSAGGGPTSSGRAASAGGGDSGGGGVTQMNFYVSGYTSKEQAQDALVGAIDQAGMRGVRTRDVRRMRGQLRATGTG